MQTIYFLKAHHTGNQYCPVLTQYHRVPASTALYWRSIQRFDGIDHANHIFSESISHWQAVLPCSDPEPPSADQYHPLLIQCHQIPTGIWKDINLQIFSQLDVLIIHMIKSLFVVIIHIRGRVWPGATCHFFLHNHNRIINISPVRGKNLIRLLVPNKDSE